MWPTVMRVGGEHEDVIIISLALCEFFFLIASLQAYILQAKLPSTNGRETTVHTRKKIISIYGYLNLKLKSHQTGNS